ncbi:MAG: DEAD/DEAH box helicase [Acidimicrobiia bacterium]|nr:DEAD/DEAH box helicase [Acidimicrobiia bacterium]
MTDTSTTDALDADTTTFGDLGLPDDLVEALERAGITAPFPIQALTIPDALAGRDVCGQARTGSGKTLAFGLPMIAKAKPAAPGRPVALVLVPTRELANQVTEVLEPLAEARDLKVVAVYGGAPMNPQINAIKNGAEIVIATPGRFIDLMERKVVHLGDIAVVAIDEADQMADMGFLPQVRRIMRNVDGEHQTMLFSATLEGQVGSLIKAYMTNPVSYAAQEAKVSIDTMAHRFLKVHQMDKVKVAAAIARGVERTLMFTATKAGCDRLAERLMEEGINAMAIHGGLQQSRREKALAKFTSGAAPVLVATNVAARGLHVEGVDVVLHYDPPDDPKTYVHRSGRTARAGEEGLVVTLVLWDQVNEALRLQKQAGVRTPIVKMFSNDERLADLTSWTPPTDDDEPLTKAEARRRNSLGRRRRRRM